MSTWTSKGATALFATILALSGCVEGGLPQSGASVTRALAVSDGAVTVTGPSGYCIDRRASFDRGESAFVLFGTCAALSGSLAAGQPEKPAILTASIVPGAPEGSIFAASLPEMARFVASEPGRAGLSRSGNAASVRVISASSNGGVLYLGLSDTSALAGASVEPDYWRAVLVLGERLVTLSAMSLTDRPLSSAEKRRTLQAFVARMKSANARAAAAG